MTDQEKFNRYMLPANIALCIGMTALTVMLAWAVGKSIENTAYLAVNPENPLEVVK